MGKRKKPTKCIITMGVKITSTNYDGEVSGVQLLNAAAVLMQDIQTMTGMQYKEIFAVVDAAVDGNVFKKNPTINAGVSAATAEDEEAHH